MGISKLRLIFIIGLAVIAFLAAGLMGGLVEFVVMIVLVGVILA